MDQHQHHHSQRGEFLKCLSEFFKRDLVSIPIVKKYPHQTVTQRSGLKAATIELDTAAYPNIEYIAGTRLSIYPLNPASHVQSIMEHLIDDVSPHATGPSNNSTSPPTQSHSTYSRQVLVNNFPKFAQLTGKDCLRLALTYLFDIMTAPSRELLHLIMENCQVKEQKKKLIAIGQSNESWEKWLCSSHRTLKSVFDEYNSCKLSAGKLLNELNIQQPRQYSISNIKSSKRSRTEIIVVQHKYSLRQIELNLHQLRDRESYEETLSPSGSPPHSPRSIIKKGAPVSPISTVKSSANHQVAAGQRSSTPTRHSPSTPITLPQPPPATSAAAHGTPESRRQRSPSRPAQRHGPTARGSKGSQRSIRSSVSYANSPITTHQVPHVSSFSGPLVSAYANATSSQASDDTAMTTATSMAPPSGTSSKDSKGHSRRSKLSLLSVLQNQDKMLKRHHADLAPSSPSTGSSQAGKFEGLCSNYLLSLNSSDQILCEFIENPRFTLKGNRERPIMMIGQDVGMIAFRAFLQQRSLEHDRAQTFYSLFQDLAPKKFGDMQLVCLTGHKGRIEDLFKREIQAALTGKILSSISYINRRHLVQLLTAATTKSQLVLTQLEQQQQQQLHSSTTSHQQTPMSPRVGSHIKSSSVGKSTASRQEPHKLELSINSKELIDLGDRIYKLLAESNGCLYTCCDPHMTQAIEILTFESIARNNRQITREQLMQLLPKWKGSRLDGQTTSSEDMAAGFFTLENTYERARIVQEIYDSSI